VVKTGDIVKVQVLEVDAQRKRIGLSMKIGKPANASAAGKAADNRFHGTTRAQHRPAQAAATQSDAQSAMAEAFAKLKR